MQFNEGAVEGGGCEIVGNVEHLGHSLRLVGFHHLARLHHDFMGLLFRLHVGNERLFIAQSEPRPHFPTRGVANFKRDPESLTCDSGGSEFDQHADGES